MSPTRWTIEKIRKGFEEFFKSNGRYPSVLEIDQYNLLPSSRQIQRKYGGVRELRKNLGLPLDLVDLTRGSIRSATAKHTWRRGTNFEKLVYDILVAYFGEMFVHAQKPFNDHKSRVDFFVFCKNYRFGIDVFYAIDSHSFVGCINAKLKVYIKANFPIILLSANLSLDDDKRIKRFLANKHLPTDIYVLNLPEFKNFIRKFQPLRIS